MNVSTTGEIRKFGTRNTNPVPATADAVAQPTPPFALDSTLLALPGPTAVLAHAPVVTAPSSVPSLRADSHDDDENEGQPLKEATGQYC